MLAPEPEPMPKTTYLSVRQIEMELTRNALARKATALPTATVKRGLEGASKGVRMATSVAADSIIGLGAIKSPHMDTYERSLMMHGKRAEAAGGDTERRQGDLIDDVHSVDDSFDDEQLASESESISSREQKKNDATIRDFEVN